MRTVTKTINYYQYDELSPAAQQKARDWYKQGDCYYWYDEFRESLDGFLRMAGITLRDWQYDEWRYDYTLSDSGFDETIEEFDTRRLIAYCHNRFDKYLTCAKRYTKEGGVWDTSRKVRNSHIVREMYSYPFTGVCFDEDFLQPIREFTKTGKFNGTYSDLIRECLDSGFKSAVVDVNYRNSDEAVEESIRCNEYEFTEDGEIA